MGFSIYILLTLIVSSSQAKDSCDLKAANAFPREDAGEILRTLQIEEVKSNANQFCNSGMLRSYLEGETKNPAQVRALSEREVQEQAKSFFSKQPDGVFTSLPFIASKELTTKSGVLLVNNDGVFGGIENDDMSFTQILEKAQTTINSDPCIHPKHDGEKLAAMIKSAGMDRTTDTVPGFVVKAAAGKMCFELVNLTQTPACTNAVANMAEDMKQRGGIPLTSMPGLLNKIVNSGKFDKGLKIAANRLIEMARQPEKIKSDVFTDLKNAFIEAGNTKEESEQMAFETLGMIGTGGPSLSKRLNKIEFAGSRWPTVTAFTSIAAIIPHLDYFASQKGNLYSLPPGMNGRCDTSKSYYYFWTAAYLARKQTQNGAPGNASAAAALSAVKAYHVMGNMTNRGGAYELFMEDTLSPESNMNRAGMTYASAGALYGAGLETGASFNIDEGLAASIQHSQILPKLSEADAGKAASASHGYGYFRFNKMYAPNEIFKAHTRERKFRDVKKLPRAEESVIYPEIQCR